MLRFLSQLWKKEPKIENEFLEKRMWIRYLIPENIHLKISFSQSEIFTLDNLSYGGGRIIHHDTLSKSKEYQNVTLSTPLSQKEVKIKPIFFSSQFVGFSFSHEEAESILFLRELVECLRKGFEMYEIDQNLIKKKGIHNFYFRGEEGNDLQIKDDLKEIILTFIDNKKYYEIVFFNEKWQTRESIHKDTIAVQPHLEIKLEILWKGVLILTGLQNALKKDRKELSFIISEWMNIIQRRVKS